MFPPLLPGPAAVREGVGGVQREASLSLFLACALQCTVHPASLLSLFIPQFARNRPRQSLAWNIAPELPKTDGR